MNHKNSIDTFWRKPKSNTWLLIALPVGCVVCLLSGLWSIVRKRRFPRKRLVFLIVIIIIAVGVSVKSAELLQKVAVVPGGDPKPDALLALAEAKLFEHKDIEMLERTKIDKVLTEQKLSGMFDATNAVELGRILKTDIFAALETTSIIIFDAQTGLRFVDETLPEQIENAAVIVSDAVKTAVEKRNKFVGGNLVTFGVLEVRNADFPVDRDAWCRAVAGMLERSLLHRGAAVLERSRLQHINRERQLTGDATNDLLASMKLIDLEFTRGEAAKTFKITARIGNETFRAESLIDKPLDAVQKIAGQLVDVKERLKIDTVKESARFLEESRFLMKSLKYEAFLEKAETAFALEPNNVECRKILFLALVMQASDMTYPNANYGHRLPSSQVHSTANVDQVQTALDYGKRALASTKENPEHATAMFHWLFERDNEFCLFWLRWKLRQLSNDQFPELSSAVDQFNAQVLEYWRETRFRSIISGINDKQTYEKAFSDLSWDAVHLFAFQSPSETVGPLEELIREMLEGCHRWNISIEHSTYFLWNGEKSPYRDILRLFTDIVTEYRSRSQGQADGVFSNLIDTLKNAPQPMLRHYAWIAENSIHRDRRFISNHKVDPEFRKQYFEKVKIRIRNLPQGTPYCEYSVYYDELKHASSGTVLQSGNREILELAISRGELATATTAWLLNTMANRTSRDGVSAEYQRLIVEQLKAVEKDNPPPLASLRSWAIRANLDLSPDKPENEIKVTPWAQEMKIVAADGIDSDKRGAFDMVCPLWFGERLYFMSVRNSQETRLVSTMLTDTKSSKFARNISDTISFRTDEPRVYSFFLEYSRPFFVDEQNAYVALRQGGLTVIPHNGDDPWSLTLDDGLPSLYVQALGSIGNRLYLGLGVPTETSWLAVVDLKTRKIEVLASSTAREGKVPFFNLSPAPYYRGFARDVKRNRLLLFVSPNGSTTLGRWTDTPGPFAGLWAIDGETGEFSQLKQFAGRVNRLNFLPNGEGLLLFSSYTNYFISINPNESDSEVSMKFLTVSGGESGWNDLERREEKPMIQGCHLIGGTVWNGYLWGLFTFKRPRSPEELRQMETVWGRVALDGQSPFETLPLPKGITSFQWNDRQIFLPTEDGTGLLIGDGRNLILLRFE